MTVKAFLDTNIWIYAHLETPGDQRCEIASRVVDMIAPTISTQVLGEYYSVMLRNKMNDLWIQNNSETMIARCAVCAVTVDIVRDAHRLKLRYGFSYWDCLIISAALATRCDVLYSEDLHHQQRIDDRLEVLNPFALSPHQ